MLSIRALSRALPKSSFRQLSPFTCRSFSAIPRSTVLRPSLSAFCRPTYRTFASSPRRCEAAGEVDSELSAKLEQELSFEKESKDSQQLPEGLQDFVESSGFEIQDMPGKEDVTLTKHFGNETVKVTFSIADLNALDQDPDQLSEDEALGDEDLEDDLTPQSSGARTKGAINTGRTVDGNFNVAPEDRVAPADRPELADDESAAVRDEMEEEDDMEPAYPIRVNVTVTKATGGAIQLETIAQDGVIDIENVYYFQQTDLAEAQSAEADFKRSEIYAGPPFGSLDEELQILFERYLDERGVNAALAQFVPDYVDFKEQKEYIRWLESIKGFVDA